MAKTTANNLQEMQVHVTLVTESNKFVGRVNIETEEELIQLDENGNETKVTQFSLQEFALRQQLTKSCKEFRKYLLLSNGNLEAGQIGMLLFGATLDITRTLKKAGEPRQFGEGVYERDTYTTEIVNVELGEDAMLEDLRASIRENKAMARVSMANPFGF